MVESGNQKKEDIMKKFWKILVALIVLVLVFYLLREVDFKKAWELFKTANFWYVALALVVYGVSFMVLAWRFKYAFGIFAKADYWFLLRLTLMGSFIGTITPATQAGGDPVRAHYLGIKYKKPKSEMFGVVLADRLYHAIISFLFILISAFFAFTFLPLSQDIKMFLQAGFFIVVFLIAVFFLFRFAHKRYNIGAVFAQIMPFIRKKKVKRKTTKSKFKKILFEHFGNFSRTFKQVAIDKKVITTGLALSTLYWVLNFTVPYLLFLSFNQSVNFFMVMVVFNVGIVISEFAPSPGGVGLIEGATFFVYALVGISVELALAVALLTRVIFYIYSLGLGGLSLIDLERKLG